MSPMYRGGKEEEGKEREGLREAGHIPGETHCPPNKEHAGMLVIINS